MSDDYVLGVQWNRTVLDSKVIVWIEDGDHFRLVSVHDPESPQPAVRVLRDGTRAALSEGQSALASAAGASTGLTVYGIYHADRPTFAEFRLLAPEYAYLADGIEQGRGLTELNITGRETR